MGEDEKAPFRVRVLFDDHRIPDNSQFCNGHGRFWIHLEPHIVTFADLASYLSEKFDIPNRLTLLIDDFALPPFLPTCMLESTDIIRVELMNIKAKDALLPCDGKKIAQDPQTVRANGFPFNKNIMADEKSQANLQGNGGNENFVHGCNLSPGIGLLKQKNEHSLELPNSMQQSEGLNIALESEPHVASAMTKDHVQSSAATTSKGRSYCSEVHEKEPGAFCIKNRAWTDKTNAGDSPGNEPNKTALHKIDFATLFPLTRSPLEGDVLAYRYVESPSTACGMLSSPKVGRVSAFDYRSSEIILVPAPEFEIFSEESSNALVSSQAASPYKRDGSLEINLPALMDVRLLKEHNSEELACLAEGTFNPSKRGKWDVASASSNWNQYDARRPGRTNGAEYSANERRGSAPWFHGTSPAAALFWETVLSKGTFGKGARCSASGKY